MTPAITMNVPAARLLAGWWRDLAHCRPRRLLFAHLVLHHIEALVECTALPNRELLANALLALLQQRSGPVTLADLEGWLGVEPALLNWLVNHLQSEGSLQRGPDGQTILPVLSPAGTPMPPRPKTYRQRLGFHFTDSPPRTFVPIAESACIALMPPAGWSFDLACLAEYFTREVSWRQNNQFSLDAHQLLRPMLLPAETQPSAIAVDRAEQALLVLVQTDSALLGFAVSPEAWELPREPVLSLPLSADFTQLVLTPLPAKAWQQAWQAWCQQRSLPTSEVEACKLEPIDHRLVVHTPARLLERLRQSRSEVARGDNWMFAGTGRVRPAVRIELSS